MIRRSILRKKMVLLVRNYIKVSPSKAAVTIGVGGDLRNVRLVPLPAPVVGSAPRLEGGDSPLTATAQSSALFKRAG
jgi:hypothetical protein